MREEPDCRTGLWTSFCMFVHSISSCQDSVSIAVRERQNKTTLASLRWSLHNPLHVSQENLVIGSNHWNSKIYFASLHIARMRKLYAKQMQPCSFPLVHAKDPVKPDKEMQIRILFSWISLRQRERGDRKRSISGLCIALEARDRLAFQCVCLSTIVLHYVAHKVFKRGHMTGMWSPY